MPEQETYSSEPAENIEAGVMKNNDYEDEEDEDKEKENIKPALFSASSRELDEELWTNIFSEQFGDAYIKNSVSDADTNVSGNTNRLIIEETDLRLAGKNGLDLVIKRKYDSQDYNVVSFAAWRETEIKYVSYRYIYNYTDISSGKAVNIGFLTPNDMYELASDKYYIKKYPSKSYNGTILNSYDNISFYLAEDIFGNKSAGETGILLQRNTNVEQIIASMKISDDLYLDGYKLLPGDSGIACGWDMIIPVSYTHLDVYKRQV